MSKWAKYKSEDAPSKWAKYASDQNTLESAQGSVFQEDVESELLPKLGPVKKGALLANELMTFGAAPYLEAAGDVVAEGLSGQDPSYRANLLNRQLEHQAARQGQDWLEPVKFARDVLMPGKTVAQRVAIPMMTSAAETMGRTDVTTPEGMQEVAQSTALAGAIPTALEGVGAGGKRLLTSEKPMSKKDMIRDFILGKARRTPSNIDVVLKNKDLLESYSKEGLENVEERLGKEVGSFKDPNFQKTDLTIDPMVGGQNVFTKGVDDILASQTTSRGVNMMDDPGMIKVLQKVKEGSLPTKVGEVFDPSSLTMKDVVSEKLSPKDLSLFYTKIDNAANYAAKNGLADIEAKAVGLRNQIKDVLRKYANPEGEWIQADKAFTELKNLEPILKDIRDAENKYLKNIKNKPIKMDDDLNPSQVQSLNPIGVARSVAASTKNLFRKYGDELSEGLAKGSPNPYEVLNAPNHFTQSILPADWVMSASDALGRAGRGASNIAVRSLEPDSVEMERFRDIYTKIPQMGPYQQTLIQASEEGRLPLVHFYLMKTDPQYLELFTKE